MQHLPAISASSRAWWWPKKQRVGRTRYSGAPRITGTPCPKAVAFLARFATVSAAANHRYLDALAVVDDPAPAHRALDRLVQPL